MYTINILVIFGLGGLGVTCSPRDPRFAGSNPPEISGSLKNLKPEKIGL